MVYAGDSNWVKYFPNVKEMPRGWPGKESSNGLRVEHLVPNCNIQFSLSSDW